MHKVLAKHILSNQNGMNIYRGCLHGCIYCDARSDCYQMKHAFVDIEIKENAPDLLDYALRHKRKKCMIGTGAMSDPYLPIEKDLRLTRRCLEHIAEHGFGATLITKSDLVLRDLDILKEINRQSKCVIQVTMTTYDEDLCRILEPNVCTTKRRAEVLNILRDEGIPTVCWMTPIIPFINDTRENIEGLLSYCVQAKVKGILQWGIGLTLRDGNREYFYEQLDKHFPGMKERYIKGFGNAYSIVSPINGELMGIVNAVCKRESIMTNADQIFAYLNEYEDKLAGEQLSLF